MNWVRTVTRRHALQLVMLGFLAVPIAVALALTLPGLPGQVAPVVLIASGVGYGVLAIHLVKDLSRLYASDEVVPGHELDEVSGERMLTDRPFAIFVPFLVTGSWMLLLIGLAWLAFVDLRLALGILAVGIALYLWRWLVAPRLRRAPPTES